MPVHSFHVFDRKGKTLFTKRYVKTSGGGSGNNEPSQSELAEQRKLVFGMLFSLREVAASLAPDDDDNQNYNSNNTNDSRDGGLHSVKTGASTLYNYETNSGLRFALFVTNDSTNPNYSDSIRQALAYIYNDLWIQYVTQSPLYNPIKPNVKETNFENKVQEYFATQPWFK